MSRKAGKLLIMERKFPTYSIGIIIVVVLILDQVTKYLIKVNMQLGQSFPVFGDFFRITYVENPGMAFGVRIENPVIFIGLSLFAAGLVFYYLFRLRKDGWILQIALSLIAAGAIGNIVDRIIYGKVIDFLDVDFFDVSLPAFKLLFINFPGYYLTRWYVFNVADSAVTVGMTFIIIYIFFYGDPLKNSQPETPQPENDSI